MKKLIIFLSFSLMLVPLAASAQFKSASNNLDTVAGPTQLTKEFDTSVSTIISAALSLLGTIFLLLTIYAGILWMTAQGNDEKVTKAKDILTAAIIGLVIVMAAYAITSFITNKLAGNGGGGGGNGTAAPATDLTCTQKGGECVAVQAGIDDDTCNWAEGNFPDDYTGDPIATCGAVDNETNAICCGLTEDAGDGQTKCKNIGGQCYKEDCEDIGKTEIGECGGSFDGNCCSIQ